MMRILSLKVEGAFGYLDFDLTFHKDLSFLTGMNGSGKTTVLKLILALLTPSLRQLDEIPHTSAVLRFSHNSKTYALQSSVLENESTLQMQRKNFKPLMYQRIELEQFIKERLRSEERIEEYYAILEDRFAEHEIIKFLRDEIDTPVFLGLERRQINLHYGATSPRHSPLEREREMRLAYAQRTGKGHVRGLLGSSLTDIQFRIQEIFKDIRGKQDKFNMELRDAIILSAFDYKPIDDLLIDLRVGTTSKLGISKEITDKRRQVEEAFQRIGVHKEKYSLVLNKFFERIEKLKAAPRIGKGLKIDPPAALLEAAINKPLLDRVLNLMQVFEQYKQRIDSLYEGTKQFLDLVNRFLIDSKKELVIDPVGWLRVQIKQSEARTLDALSSGERQIVVLLGNLAINKQLDRPGIFIVDEPELSLHLKWQEIFVDSIIQASPKNQFILATHSPAIVLDRDDRCIDME